MQTIQWQDNDTFEEENEPSQLSISKPKGMIVEEKEDGKALQLKKFQDPAKDEVRQAYLNLIHRFGSLFAAGNLSEIATDLLTEDCEVFVFSSIGNENVQCADHPQGFIELYKDIQILERWVKETHVDVEKRTGCQVSSYKLVYSGDTNHIDAIACEIFSIREGRISKFRASYGCPELGDCLEDPLEPTRKDKMLAKVKQINYALAGQPNLKKMAALLSENTEYKIWRWDDFKCFTLYRNKFAESFNQLQENMSIKRIIPYDISADQEGKFISGNYIYELEDNKTGKKCEWFSTCAYYFDDFLDITKMIQQGELYPEGETDVPFEVHTRLKLENANSVMYTGDIKKLDSIFAANVLYDCSIWSIYRYSLEAPNAGCIKGLKNIEKLLLIKENLKEVESMLQKNVDVYVDHHNESHDVLFALTVFEGKGPWKATPGCKKLFNSMEFSRVLFENGKIAKIIQFLTEVDVPIPTPFDDKSFHCTNIKNDSLKF